MDLVPVAAALAAALFLGGVIKGAIGFGLPLISVPLMALAVDIRIALALMTIPIFASNIRQAIRGGMIGEILRRFWWLLLALALGFVLGGVLLVRLDADYLLAVVGLAVIVFVLSSLGGPPRALPRSLERPLGLAAGVVGGILGALSTFFGPPIVMYLVALQLPPRLLVATIGAIWLWGGILLIGTYTSAEILTWQLALLSVLCIAPVLVGQMAGEWLRERINQRLFRAATLSVLFVIGVSMLRHALPAW